MDYCPCPVSRVTPHARKRCRAPCLQRRPSGRPSEQPPSSWLWPSPRSSTTSPYRRRTRSFTRGHDIEVENTVSALLDYVLLHCSGPLPVATRRQRDATGGDACSLCVASSLSPRRAAAPNRGGAGGP